MYEESSYAFTRHKSREPLVKKRAEKRQFGESFMITDRKAGELMKPMTNEFRPEKLGSPEHLDIQSDRILVNFDQDSRRRIAKPSAQDEAQFPIKKSGRVLPRSETQKAPKIYEKDRRTFLKDADPLDIRMKRTRHKFKQPQNTLPTKQKKGKPKAKSVENDISLDVKRTFANRKDFDHVSLEQILRNISHPKMGNFAYYQGLNYVIGYFLEMIESPVETYNISMMLMETYFRKYVGRNLDGLAILSHTLRRLLQIFLPRLAAHIDRNDSLIAGSMGANWILTLFTNLKKYKPHIRLLDQILDIFMAKGWVGFFKCVLVLFYYLERDILSLQSDQLLMFLNKFGRKGFEKLGEKFPSRSSTGRASIHSVSDISINMDSTSAYSVYENNQVTLRAPLFNFKDEINEFDSIDRLLLIEFTMEYQNTKEAFENQWNEILVRLDSLAK